MLPSLKYQNLVEQGDLTLDSAQAEAVNLLDNLYRQVVSIRPPSWWQRFISAGSGARQIKGIYFWGGVGRGKTLLMDIFYQSLPASITRDRIHFHGFMNRIHDELKQLQNVDNPLTQIAADLAGKNQLLCLDEFAITDIGDAMIMAGLLEELFSRGVILITTSNVTPDNLYIDGLQRARFLPAIQCLNENCQVFNLDGSEDHRLRFLQKTELYAVPHSDIAEAGIRQFLNLTVAMVNSKQSNLSVNGRIIEARFCAEDVAWFDFSVICGDPRSQLDYLELARLFNTIIVTDITLMDKTDDDVARRFLLLIDVLYDHRVNFICSAAAAPHQLYSGQRLRFEFERTSSRLIEMQSQDYLAGAHNPASSTSRSEPVIQHDLKTDN